MTTRPGNMCHVEHRMYITKHCLAVAMDVSPGQGVAFGSSSPVWTRGWILRPEPDEDHVSNEAFSRSRT